LGGSADLTPSNNTKAKNQIEIRPGEYKGSYVHYGVREHGMAATMNGIALHGGLIPYGGTFLCFSDYCRPAIRLAAMMDIRTIFVMTHDSIGLREDGPTHQPAATPTGSGHREPIGARRLRADRGGGWSPQGHAHGHRL
jgi:transketolase